jgi:hypothetical protein
MTQLQILVVPSYMSTESWAGRETATSGPQVLNSCHNTAISGGWLTSTYRLGRSRRTRRNRQRYYA